MVIESFFKMMIFVLIVGLAWEVYRNRTLMNRKNQPFTLKEIYLSEGWIKEGILIECKTNDEAKAKHLETIAWLRTKITLESLEWTQLDELEEAIQLGNETSQFESSKAFYQEERAKLEAEMSELTIKNNQQQDTLTRLAKENKKLRSYQKFTRRV